MSDDDVSKVEHEAQELKRHLHNYAIGGKLSDIGMIPFGYDLSLTNPELYQKIKGRKRSHGFEELLDQINEEIQQLFERLYAELDALQLALENLEIKMQNNRRIWEDKIDILNDIDDLFCDLDNGGNLIRERIAQILKRINIQAPEDASDAELVLILEQLIADHHHDIEALDTEYGGQEKTHKTLKQRERSVNTAIHVLGEIEHNESLDYDEKLIAIRQLSDEVGTNDLHVAATEVQGSKIGNEADGVFFNHQEDQNLQTTLNPLAPP